MYAQEEWAREWSERREVCHYGEDLACGRRLKMNERWGQGFCVLAKGEKQQREGRDMPGGRTGAGC